MAGGGGSREGRPAVRVMRQSNAPKSTGPWSVWLSRTRIWSPLPCRHCTRSRRQRGSPPSCPSSTPHPSPSSGGKSGHPGKEFSPPSRGALRASYSDVINRMPMKHCWVKTSRFTSSSAKLARPFMLLGLVIIKGARREKRDEPGHDCS